MGKVVSIPRVGGLHHQCESRVEAEQIEGRGQFSIAVDPQAFMERTLDAFCGLIPISLVAKQHAWQGDKNLFFQHRQVVARSFRQAKTERDRHSLTLPGPEQVQLHAVAPNLFGITVAFVSLIERHLA
jgi:hypothetical protein